MYPILFQYNNFQISTYGFMLMMAFIICNYLLRKYLKSEGVNPSIGEDIIFYAAIGGIIGAKLYYILEYYNTGEGYNNLMGLYSMLNGMITLNISMVISGLNDFGSGLVFLGGLIGGMITVSLYIYKRGLKWTMVSDWVAPYLIFGQAIGRLGCFFVGCCYGRPSSSNWLFPFPNGRPPTTYESFQYNHPDIFNTYIKNFYSPGSPINVHPTQLYEFVLYIIIFFVLLYRRNNKLFDGQIMIEYLLLAGLSRFLIEFIRLNPTYILGLSSAQIFSIIMVSISTTLILFNIKISNYGKDKL